MNLAKFIRGSKLLRMTALQPAIKNLRNSSSIPNATSSDIKPTTSEKYYLVWTGKYKSIDEIPRMIPKGAMERAKGIMRIRFANTLMVLVLIMCVGICYSGKKKSEEGIGITQIVMDRHKRLKEEAENKKLEENNP